MTFEIPEMYARQIFFLAIQAWIFNVVETNCELGPQILSNAEADKRAKQQK